MTAFVTVRIFCQSPCAGGLLLCAPLLDSHTVVSAPIGCLGFFWMRVSITLRVSFQFGAMVDVILMTTLLG